MDASDGFPGKLVIVEGADGCGKSTAVAHIAMLLQSRGEEAVVCRLPGGTATGEVIRSFFKENATSIPIEDQISMLLLAKRQLIKEIITPALALGKYVICDRFLDSLYAYQWAGFSEFAPEIKQRIDDNVLIYGVDVNADLKIVLDCPIAESENRMQSSRVSENDVLDQMNRRFKSRVRSYYRDHLVESAQGTTVYLNTMEGREETLRVVSNLVSTLLYPRIFTEVPEYAE